MTRHTSGKQRGSRLVRYVGDIVNELKKVVWLNRREAAYLTVMVLVVSGAFAIILGGLDYSFTALIDKVFLGK